MPEKEAVEFNFDAYAKTIADLIVNRNNKTPLVIGVYGAWGSGKTTLMETVKSRLKEQSYQDKNVFRKCKCVWFQAWKYAQEEQILAALIEEIFRTMQRDGFFQEAKAGIEKLIKRFNIFNAFGIGINSLIKVDPVKFFSQLEY
jgi:iron(II)-dependent oxidoreductase